MCVTVFAGPLLSTTYYLDFSGGSNGNDGLSPETAWKDLFKIRDAKPAPGDEFLFKRGESWAGVRLYIDASGTAASPITYAAYGDAADPLPVISTVTDIPNADDASAWTNTGGNIWTLSLIITPGRLFLDGTEHLRASTMADVGLNDSQGSFGDWYYDIDSEILYLYATGNPADEYSLFEGSNNFYSALVDGANYMEFQNIDFRGGNGAALGILGGSYIDINNCRLGRAGNSGLLLAEGLAAAGSPSTTEVTVADNIFDSQFTFFYGLGSERGCGDGIRLFGGVNNCTVWNNTFINWAHNAIELFGNSTTAAGVNDNEFFNNHISAPDIPYAHPLGADGYLGKCQNNEFYRNYIENCRTASQVNGNNNWVHHNIIVGMRNSPSKDEPTAHAFILGIYRIDLVSKNNRFDHNLIIDTDESGFLVRGYGFAGQVENNAIRNNILYETGQAPSNNAYAQGTGLVIYDTDMDGVGGNIYRNNLFYSTTTTEVIFNQDNSTYYNSTQFDALDGIDGNTIGNNDFGDPLFTDLANADFLPMDNSPAVNAGIDVSLALDYTLQPRLIGPAPDIGPFETAVVTPLPVEWGEFRLESLENMVRLHWATLSEQNSDYFGIERSSNGRKWEEIDRVAAGWNRDVPASYSFVDHTPLSGLSYYRLRQVDLDGAYEYAEMISCERVSHSALLLTRADRNTLLLSTNGAQQWADAEIHIFDSMGRRCFEASKNSREISIGDLPEGVYILLVKTADLRRVFKFTK